MIFASNPQFVVFSEKEILEAKEKDKYPNSRFPRMDESPYGKMVVRMLDLMGDENKRKEIGQNANQLFQYDAADEIASVVLKDMKKK